MLHKIDPSPHAKARRAFTCGRSGEPISSHQRLREPQAGPEAPPRTSKTAGGRKRPPAGTRLCNIGVKYQEVSPAPGAASEDFLTLKLRYKDPEGSESKKREFPVEDG